MKRTEKYLSALKDVFVSSPDKHEANFKSRQIMAEMAGDAKFFTEILQQHLQKDENFNTLHYPVVSIEIALNEYFSLIANCWIPLPDRSTDISTKAIHHHGDMLLTTATAFGKGYEHWMFETPSVVDAEKEIYELKILEKSPHPLHHVAFVDAYIAHLPLYPPDLTITYALWSNRFPTNWKDKVKRLPILQKNSSRLREIAKKLGLAKQLDLKVVEYFDFYPSCEGFRGIRERSEFPRTTNEDYLASLFHIIQETGNERLASEINKKLNFGGKINNRKLIEGYVKDLESGRQIEGRLSPEHYGVAQANFTKEEILQALVAQNGNTQSAVATN